MKEIIFIKPNLLICNFILGVQNDLSYEQTELYLQIFS